MIAFFSGSALYNGVTSTPNGGLNIPGGISTIVGPTASHAGTFITTTPDSGDIALEADYVVNGVLQSYLSLNTPDLEAHLAGVDTSAQVSPGAIYLRHLGAAVISLDVQGIATTGGIGVFGHAVPSNQPTVTIRTSTITDPDAKTAIQVLIDIINGCGLAALTES